MKRLNLTIILLLISTYISFGNTWEVINEKTWISNKDFPTSQYVFYETSNGFKKAIFQINGSGRCAVLSLIYDVELNGDTISLKNELTLDSLGIKKGTKEKRSLTLIIKDDSTIISNELTYDYQKSFEDARICNWIETYSGNQIIPIQELKAIPIKENQIYEIHSFKLGPNPENCGIDNRPELTDTEVIFFSQYLKIPAQKSGFDFKNKKILFVTGSNGSTLGSKIEYFNDVREWKEKHNDKIATSLIILNDSEKSEYGYDAIVTYWVKVYNPKRKRVLEQTKNK
jgi:hypothetical protein